MKYKIILTDNLVSSKWNKETNQTDYNLAGKLVIGERTIHHGRKTGSSHFRTVSFDGVRMVFDYLIEEANTIRELVGEFDEGIVNDKGEIVPFNEKSIKKALKQWAGKAPLYASGIFGELMDDVEVKTEIDKADHLITNYVEGLNKKSEVVKDKIRQDKYVSGITVLALDCDNDPSKFKSAEDFTYLSKADAIQRFNDFGLSFLIVNSSSSTPECERFRIFLPLAEPIDRHQFQSRARTFQNKFLPELDNGAFKYSQAFYLPYSMSWKNELFPCEVHDGWRTDEAVLDWMTLEVPVSLPTVPRLPSTTKGGKWPTAAPAGRVPWLVSGEPTEDAQRVIHLGNGQAPVRVLDWWQQQTDNGSDYYSDFYASRERNIPRPRLWNEHFNRFDYCEADEPVINRMNADGTTSTIVDTHPTCFMVAINAVLETGFARKQVKIFDNSANPKFWTISLETEIKQVPTLHEELDYFSEEREVGEYEFSLHGFPISLTVIDKVDLTSDDVDLIKPGFINFVRSEIGSGKTKLISEVKNRMSGYFDPETLTYSTADYGSTMILSAPRKSLVAGNAERLGISHYEQLDSKFSKSKMAYAIDYLRTRTKYNNVLRDYDLVEQMDLLECVRLIKNNKLIPNDKKQSLGNDLAAFNREHSGFIKIIREQDLIVEPTEDYVNVAFRGMSVCVPSLTKVGSAEVYVADESGQTMREVYSRDAESRHLEGCREQVRRKHYDLIAKADTVILLDAGFRQADLLELLIANKNYGIDDAGFIRQVDGSEQNKFNAVFSKPIHLVVNKGHRGGKYVRMYGGKSSDTIKQDAIDYVLAGNPTWIMTNSIRNCNEFEDKLKVLKPELRILKFHSEVVDADELDKINKFLISPNEEIFNYDVVITSPSVNTGLSVEVDYVKEVFGIYELLPNGYAADDALQSMLRNRRTETINCWIAPNKNVDLDKLKVLAGAVLRSKGKPEDEIENLCQSLKANKDVKDFKIMFLAMGGSDTEWDLIENEAGKILPTALYEEVLTKELRHPLFGGNKIPDDQKIIVEAWSVLAADKANRCRDRRNLLMNEFDRMKFEIEIVDAGDLEKSEIETESQNLDEVISLWLNNRIDDVDTYVEVKNKLARTWDTDDRLRLKWMLRRFEFEWTEDGLETIDNAFTIELIIKNHFEIVNASASIIEELAIDIDEKSRLKGNKSMLNYDYRYAEIKPLQDFARGICGMDFQTMIKNKIANPIWEGKPPVLEEKFLNRISEYLTEHKGAWNKQFRDVKMSDTSPEAAAQNFLRIINHVVPKDCKFKLQKKAGDPKNGNRKIVVSDTALELFPVSWKYWCNSLAFRRMLIARGLIETVKR